MKILHLPTVYLLSWLLSSNLVTGYTSNLVAGFVHNSFFYLSPEIIREAELEI